MKIEILNNENLILPKQGTKLSSGFDIVASEDPEIVGETFGSTSLWTRVDYIQYRTGLKISPNSEHTHTLIYPRSSVSKYNLVLANSIGLIDNDYRGEILLRFKYIFQPEDVVFFDPSLHPSFAIVVNQKRIYQKGDKIGQLVFGTSYRNIHFDVVNNLDETHRNEGGFGHTDGK